MRYYNPRKLVFRGYRTLSEEELCAKHGPPPEGYKWYSYESILDPLTPHDNVGYSPTWNAMVDREGPYAFTIKDSFFDKTRNFFKSFLTAKDKKMC